MRIATLELSALDIPFRISFKHASAERVRTESAWVKARSTAGAVGNGESCPRRYVTGECLATVRAFFDRYRRSLIAEIRDMASLRDWTWRHRAEIDRNPAAWCAIELALIELVAVERGDSVEAALGVPELCGAFHYTAVLGDADTEAFRKLLDRYRSAGFTDFKLKLSGALSRDRARLGLVTQRAGTQSVQRVRLDANNLWRDAGEAAHYLLSLDALLAGIEEPLRAGDHTGLARLAERIRAPIILDESACRSAQLDHLAGAPDRWIVNLRVSKMGGLLRSLDFVARLRERGHRLVVGTQVGETSLLARAALTVANGARDLLFAQEGAFGPLLLERDVCVVPLVFGAGGVLPAPTVPAVGFGLDIEDADLDGRLAAIPG